MKIVLTRALSCLLAFALALPIGGTAQSPGQAPPPQDGPAFSQEQLDQLLAPIALYPDPLLAQILMASTYPLEVVEASRWVQANPNVQDQALEDAMQQKSWDPSVKSLTALPEVLQMMNEKLEWTQQLGDAFLAQQEQVMATVQGLRAKAQAAGNLGSSTEQVVTSEQTGGTTIITVEPANPQIVYVPTYDPMVVYGAWPYPAYPPYYWYPPGYVAGGIISFGFGVAVGAALWGGCNWGHRNVYINNVNRYNSFNRTTISNNHWQHNVDHRRGVAYRDQRVAQQYNRGSATRDVQSREQFRGYSDQGRHTFQSGNFGQYRGDRTGAGGGAPIGGARAGAGTSDLGAGRGAGGAGGGRPSASTGAIGGGGRPSASTGAIGGGGRPSASTGGIGGGGAGTRDFGSASRGGGASAFDGVGRGTQTRGYSSRGNSSLGASRAGGGGGGGGAHTGGGGGGGGARTGGGGGGGGARSGGGGGRR